MSDVNVPTSLQLPGVEGPAPVPGDGQQCVSRAAEGELRDGEAVVVQLLQLSEAAAAPDGDHK